MYLLEPPLYFADSLETLLNFDGSLEALVDYTNALEAPFGRCSVPRCTS